MRGFSQYMAAVKDFAEQLSDSDPF
jgi:hypothetical protein